MSNTVPPVACPYFGLQPATEKEAAYFFGREGEQQIIKINLYGQPLTVLYGASGVGKSSLLLAGVTPQLVKPNQAVVVFRQYQDDDIAGSLKGAILEAVRQSAQDAPQVDASLPLDAFMLECNRAVRGPIFIILDQFEGYFLHHPPSAATAAFEAQFARVVNSQEIDVHLLLALREDRLSNLDRFQGRINSFQNMLRVEAMTREAAANAIRRPLEKYNELQRPGRAVSIEDELVEELLGDVTTGQDAPGARSGGRVDMPSLQLALINIWEEEEEAGSRVLRLATYRRLGGAARIVGSHLDRIMAGFDAPDRRLAARMFRYLVTPAGVKMAHTAEDLAKYLNEERRAEGADKYPEEPVENVERVLGMLCEPGVRILQRVAPLPGQPDVTRYEIFHDVLGPAVLEWQRRYREEEIRRFEQKRLGELRDIERAKRLRRTVVAMAIVLLLLSGVTAVALRARHEAVRQNDMADKQRKEADKQGREAERQRTAAEEQRKEADKQRMVAEEQTAEAQSSEMKAKKARDAAVAAEEQSRKSLQAEKLAKAESEQRAREAYKAREIAEAAEAEAKQQKQIAEQQKQIAEQQKQIADEQRDAALQAQQNEVVARIKADQSAKVAQAEKEKADKATQETVKSINLVKKIDESAPFSGGVIRNPVPLYNAALSSDLNSIVTSNEAGQVLYWKMKDVTNPPQDKLTTKYDEAALELPSPHAAPLLTALSGDGQLAATVAGGVVYVWAPKAVPDSVKPTQHRGDELKVPGGQPGKVTSLAVTSSADRKYVAAGYDKGALAVWNLDACGARREACVPFVMQAHAETINSIAFSPDGGFLATASGAAPPADERKEDCKAVKGKDNTAKVWEIIWGGPGAGGSLRRIKTLEGHRCRVNSVAFNRPEHNRKNLLLVVTASEDGTARTWNILHVKERDAHGAITKWNEVRSDSHTLDVYEAPRVPLWIVRQPIRKIFSYSFGLDELSKVQVPLHTAAFSPVNDEIVATSGEEGALRIWDVPSSSTVRIIQGHYGRVRNVAFSPGGNYIVSASEDKTVRLWNVCEARPESNARRSIVANLTTDSARLRLKTYCEHLPPEPLPK